MRHPEYYYLGALKNALQGNLEDALLYREQGQESKEYYGFDFSEAASENLPFIEEAVETLLGSLDFTRCVRPNGTVYGTRGKCRQGTEQAKTETPKASSKGSSRLEKELVRSGVRFQPPGRMKEESEEEIKARKERVKRSDEAERARKERLKAFDTKTTKMAEELFSSSGGVSDGSIRAQNGVKNIKENLESAHRAGRGSKTTKLIEKGDIKGLLQHAREVNDIPKQEYAKMRANEERERQKAELKESLAKAKERGASKEEIAKIREDAKFYNKRDLQRAAAQAVLEHEALWRLLRP